jgi:hypothetical protein
MTSMNDEAKILKADTRGRVRVPVERREELLNEFEGSGVSAMRFAKMVGINYATFANWRQKRREARAKIQADAASEDTAATGGVDRNQPVRLFEAFMEPRRSAAASRGGLIIELSSGARIVVESPTQLRMAAELIGMLGPTARRSC